MEILISQRLLRIHTFKPYALNIYVTEVRPKEVRSQPY